ncbi:MAG TPA: outer membrane beta-barrel family protein [Chitinophagaceae bacterium]|nr:outer membrane beta-barrel family protein [Chitinophagaceae bacterium]
MDYNVTKKGTLGFSASYINNNIDESSLSTTDIDNSGTTEDNFLRVTFDAKQKWYNAAENLNYRIKLDTLGASLTFDADYSYYKNSRSEDYINILSDKVAVLNTKYLRNTQPVDISVYSFKSDYSGRAWRKYLLDFGIKSSYVVTNNLVAFDTLNAQVWVPDNTFTNNFDYKENVNAVYGNLRREFKKLSYQAGLRIENTNSDGLSETQNRRVKRSYVDFFPTVFIGYKISKTQSARISYGRRIDRPTYRNLNPFIFFLDQYTYYQGNSFLNPQYSNNFEFAYQVKQYNFSAGFSHTNSLMSFITSQNDSSKVGIASHYNLDDRFNYFVSATLPIAITKWWSSFNNINANYTRIKSYYLGVFYDRGIYAVQAVSNNSFSIPKNIKLELNWLYVSPQVFGISRTNPYYVLSGGIRFPLGKNKWDFRGNIVDILNTDKGSGSTNFQNQHLNFQGRTRNSRVRLSLTYKFGSNNTRQSKSRSGLDEESKRIKFDAQ